LRERLLRDARAAAGLSHPHIVGVFDVVEQGETAWLVMEYVAGETLAQRLAAGPPLDFGFALRILAEMASALDYTHARGVIHRDIKPSNVMIDTHGAAKIMDFGIAHLSQARTTTPTGMVMGTLEYMAPEQIKGEPLDGRADQFALAAVAYQMLTGSTLFGPQSMTTLSYKVVHEMPPPARARNPGLPPGVDEVLSRALRKQPAERFVNCAGFIGALSAAFAGNVPVAAPTEQTTAEAAAGKKWLWAGIAAALVLVCALALGGVMLMRRQNRGSQPIAAVPQRAAPQPQVSSPSTAPPSAAPGGTPAPAPSSIAPGGTPAPAPPSAAPGGTPAPAPSSTAPGGTPAPAPSSTAPKATPTGAPQAGTKPAPQPVPPPPIEPPPPVEPKPASPGVADQSLERASALIEKRDLAGAVALLSKVIASHPNSAHAYELRGLANQELKLFENAIQDYTADLRLNPTHAFALDQRGVCHVELKQDDAALADFNRALQLRPDFASTYITRGHLFLRRHQPIKAVADFDQAIKLAPNSIPAYLGRSAARRQNGNIAGADKDEKKANELKRH
jgi:serine/threonine-protein kinase